MRISSIAPLNNNITIKSKMQTNAARVTNFAEDNNKKILIKMRKQLLLKVH